MERLVHPPDTRADHRPRRPRRLSTVGHAETLEALARATRAAGVRFMLIGGTYRDAFIRRGSTRDIDIVLADRDSLPDTEMRAIGFFPRGPSQHAWERRAGPHRVIVEVAAIASTREARGPFSIAYRQARIATVDGVRVRVPRIEDYVILKLLAAKNESRRLARDLVDIAYALESQSADELRLPTLRGRLRELYGYRGQKLQELMALLRLARTIG